MAKAHYRVGNALLKQEKFDEANECFRLFDKKDKGHINGADVRAVFSNYLEFQITPADIDDFV